MKLYRLLLLVFKPEAAVDKLIPTGGVIYPIERLVRKIIAR